MPTEEYTNNLEGFKSRCHFEVIFDIIFSKKLILVRKQMLLSFEKESNQRKL